MTKKTIFLFAGLLVYLITMLHNVQAQDWVQTGIDIDGEAVDDFSSYSVSLSADGSVVAIGAPYNDGNGSDAGHVRIYENISGTWTQIGSDIDGEAMNDYSGSSVSLSSDGSVVAIGAWGNDENGEYAGHVRIYENISGTWTQIGDDIDGEAAFDNLGRSVSLSADGSVVAIGANYNDGNGTDAGHVRIYENQSGTWTQLGSDIDGEAAFDESGYSVSLNSNGSAVAIGAYKNDGNGTDAGHVRVYKFPMPPFVTSQPESQTNICLGEDISFTVEGINIDNYQWQVDEGSGYGNIANGGVYSNATTGTLNINGVTLAMNNYWYRCVLSNAVGNTTSESAILTTDNELPVITCVGNQTVYADETHFYTVNGTEFDPPETTDNCGISSIENDFNNSATLDGAQIPEGINTIIWIVNDLSGNYEFCAHSIVVEAYVGIETLQQKGILIYPNPTKGELNIEFTNTSTSSGASSIQKLTISDITGKQIIERSDIHQIERIDISSFESGIYIISIQTDKEILITKIVKN